MHRCRQVRGDAEPCVCTPVATIPLVAGRDISATRFAYLTEPPNPPRSFNILHTSSTRVLPLDPSPLSTTLDSIYLQSCCGLISWSRRKLDYITERRMLLFLIDRVWWHRCLRTNLFLSSLWYRYILEKFNKKGHKGTRESFLHSGKN